MGRASPRRGSCPCHDTFEAWVQSRIRFQPCVCVCVCRPQRRFASRCDTCSSSRCPALHPRQADGASCPGLAAPHRADLLLRVKEGGIRIDSKGWCHTRGRHRPRSRGIPANRLRKAHRAVPELQGRLLPDQPSIKGTPGERAQGLQFDPRPYLINCPKPRASRRGRRWHCPHPNPPVPLASSARAAASAPSDTGAHHGGP